MNSSGTANDQPAAATSVEIWMPLYIGDFLGETQAMNTEQVGAYVLLAIAYWLRGALPDDDQVLAQTCKLSVRRWKAIRPLLETSFIVSDSLWRNPALDSLKQKAQQHRLA